jgi:hypothetical protein
MRAASGVQPFLPGVMRLISSPPSGKKINASEVETSFAFNITIYTRGRSVTSTLTNGAKSGTIKTLNAEKQARHMLGSKDYIAGRSSTTLDNSELQEIINTKSGTGIRSKGGTRERITAVRIIGTSINPKYGHKTLTDNATIHYSNTGTHLVPTATELRKKSVEQLWVKTCGALANGWHFFFANHLPCPCR